MKKQRTGFEYIDLDKPNITEKYRPYPASNPTEAYVARLREKNVGDEDDRDADIVTVVNAVYRLIPELHPRKGFRGRKSDRRILAVRVTRKDLVDMLRRHYDQTFEEDLDFEEDLEE